MNPSELTIRSQAFIDGEFAPAAAGRTFAAVSPRDGRELAQVARGNGEDIDRAVRAARRAFKRGDWALSDPAQRGRVLVRLADLIVANLEKLALLESLDTGHPIGDARSVDVPNAARCLAWYGEAIDKVYGQIAPTAADALALISREPLGVVGAVVPWNYPLIISAWKLAPALAAGNSIVLKPAEQSPLSALALAELAAEAGIPPGVLNVVPGYGEEAGEALGRHPDVDIDRLHTALVNSPANSNFLEHDVRSVLDRGDHDAGFAMKLVTKDLGLAVDLARDVGVPVELAALVERIHRRTRSRYGDHAGRDERDPLIRGAGGNRVAVAYVVIAKWIANEGEEAAVAAAIEALAQPSRAEPGNLVYQPHRDPQDPRAFLIYEQAPQARSSRDGSISAPSGLIAVPKPPIQ